MNRAQLSCSYAMRSLLYADTGPGELQNIPGVSKLRGCVSLLGEYDALLESR